MNQVMVQKFLLRTLMAIGVTVIMGVVVCAVIAIRLVTTCEHNLYYFRNVLWSTEWYIEETKGRWPRSWEDLQKYGIQQKMRLTAEDYEKLKQEVFIDFTIDPDKVNYDDPKSFTGIKAPEPCYECDRDIAELLTLLKKYRKGSK